ncbi:hypothetical protein [Aquimarina macrocephali]|uniref:hypothetical protein n=1 Tax=Aquimarina macrocephali TaxID=666563 RepID=UPI003F672F39
MLSNILNLTNGKTMKKLLIKSILPLGVCLFLLSCTNQDEIVYEPETEELVWKTLATLQLPNNNTVTFQFNGEDFYYEERGSIDNEMIGFENNDSCLKRFLTLTEDHIAVPKAFIDAPDFKDVQELISTRKMIETHKTPISILPSTISKLKNRGTSPVGVVLSQCNSFLTGGKREWVDSSTNSGRAFFFNYTPLNWKAGPDTHHNWAVRKSCRALRFKIGNCDYERKVKFSVTQGEGKYFQEIKTITLSPRTQVSDFISNKWFKQRVRGIEFHSDWNELNDDRTVGGEILFQQKGSDTFDNPFD